MIDHNIRSFQAQISLLKYLAEVDDLVLPNELEIIFGMGDVPDKEFLYHTYENPMSRDEAAKVLVGHTFEEKILFLHAIAHCCGADNVFDPEEKVFVKALVKEILGEEKVEAALALIKNIVDRASIYTQLGLKGTFQ